MQWSDIKAWGIGIIGVVIFVGLVAINNVFAGVMWLITIILLSWLWWNINDEVLEIYWFFAVQIFFLVFGILLFSYSELMILYYMFLAILGVLVYLEVPLEKLFQKS